MDHHAVLAIVSAVWVALEVTLGIVTGRSSAKRSSHDRGSLALLWILLVAGCVAGSMARVFWSFARMPYGNAFFWLGIGLIVAGIAIRAAAIATLRRFFTVEVAIHESHALIDRGLYRLVRHPAYSGSLVSFAGLGLALGNWVSLIVILGAALIGFANRIRVEEEALTSHFGDRYREYAAHTRRLIPGIY